MKVEVKVKIKIKIDYLFIYNIISYYIIMTVYSFYIPDRLTETFKLLYNSGSFNNFNVNLVFTEEVKNGNRKVVVSGGIENIQYLINTTIPAYVTYFTKI